MNDDKYKRLIEDDKARKAFIERDIPYDPKTMESRMPLSCGLIIAGVIVAVIYFVVKMLKG